MAKGGKKGGGSGGDGGGDTPLNVIGTAGSDRLSGGALDDRITGLGGNDQIKGNGGTDTAVYGGGIEGYSITSGKRGAVIVTDIDMSDGDDGTDTLYSVELLEFSNYTYSTTAANNMPLVTYADTVAVSENGTAEYIFTVQAMNGDDPRGYITQAGVAASWTEITLSDDGTTRRYTYEIGSGWGPSIEALAQGETTLRTFEIVAGTLYGGYLFREEVTATIVGINDAPEMSDGVLIAQEDGGPRAADLSVLGSDIDSDDDGSTLTYRIVDAPAEFDTWVDGTTLFFDPGDAFQALERTDSAFVTLTVEAVDAHGAVSDTATITVEVEGVNDPLPTYLNGDGSVNYASLGLMVPTALGSGFNGFAPTPELLEFVTGTAGDDMRIVKATQIASLDDNTSFGYPDTTVLMGGGDDHIAFVLAGQAVSMGGFSGVDVNKGSGNDVVVIDATRATDSFYINVTDIRTGDGSDQVLVDLTTEGNGWIDDFRYGLDIDTGNDNDLVSFRRVDSNGGAEARTYFTMSTGEGDDEIDILFDVGNVQDGRMVGTVYAGGGNDVARVDTSGTTGAGAEALTGLYGTINMGLGDDVLYLNLADPVEADAYARINAGTGAYVDTAYDILHLEMAGAADFTVTDISYNGMSNYLIEWNGQALEAYGWDEIYASDIILV